MAKVFSTSLILLVSLNVNAHFSIPGIENSAFKEQNQTALQKAGLNDFQDEVVDEKNIELNDKEKHQAKVWQLTIDEEKRYLQLMESRSGVYYQGLRLTPLDILGLNARDDNERERFAAKAAKFEAQKVAQNIAWNNAFYQAYNKLFKDIPVIGDFDPKPYSPLNHKPIQLKENDHLYLFIRQQDAIKTILMLLIDAIQQSPKSSLHLMFLDMDEVAIQLWGNKNQIPIDLVHSNQITLSQGKIQYEGLTIQNKTTPLLLLSRDKSTRVVDLGRF